MYCFMAFSVKNCSAFSVNSFQSLLLSDQHKRFENKHSRQVFYFFIKSKFYNHLSTNLNKSTNKSLTLISFSLDTDNAGVIVNPKGEMKGSVVTGPIAKECAEFWPKIASKAASIL